jgi:hypothetical protein
MSHHRIESNITDDDLLNFNAFLKENSIFFFFNKSQQLYYWTLSLWTTRINFLFRVFLSADGSYEVTLMTKATVLWNGAVIWQPPAIYKSSCAIDVEFFPYDIQTCMLKVGSWTYDGFQVELMKFSKTY